MSIEALNWAINVRTGDMALKCLLMVLADVANENGASWYSHEEIAKRCECSRATIIRYVRSLEKAGLLFRAPRKTVKGGRTSDISVLLCSLKAEVFAAGLGWEKGQYSHEMAETDNDPTTEAGVDGADPCCNLQHPPVATCNTPHVTAATANTEPSLNPYPQSPLQIAEREFAEAFSLFLKSYPAGDEPVDKARRAFAALSPDDRVAAVAGISDYRKRLGQKKPSTARVYLRDRLWDVASAYRKAGVTGAGDMVFVIVGTPAFEAWEAHEKATGKRRRMNKRLFIDGRFEDRIVWMDPIMHQQRQPDGSQRTGYWRTSLFPPRADGQPQGAVAAAAGTDHESMAEDAL